MRPAATYSVIHRGSGYSKIRQPFRARHVARCCGLRLTGSLGLLIKAIRHGAPINLSDAINQMRAAGVWISDSLAAEALRLAQIQSDGLT